MSTPDPEAIEKGKRILVQTQMFTPAEVAGMTDEQVREAMRSLVASTARLGNEIRDAFKSVAEAFRRFAASLTRTPPQH